ncbi:MAG: hypothetical protein ABW088_11930 [Sedimenticola sp.]
MSNADRKQWLENQINLRFDLLEQKCKGGLPELRVPKSLTKCRLWENGEFGIEKIGSPSSFVTTHEEHGKKIKKISKLLSQLSRPRKPKVKPAAKKNTELSAENTKLTKLLKNTSNQFVQYSHELKRLKDEVVLLKSREVGLVEEIEELKAELLQSKSESMALRKQLIQYQEGNTNKVTRIDFSNGD